MLWNEFHLKLKESANGRINVATVSNGRIIEQDCNRPFDEQTVAAFRARLEAAARQSGDLQQDASFVKETGEQLFAALFKDRILVAFNGAFKRAVADNRSLRLRIEPTGALLKEYPFEALYSSQIDPVTGFLARHRSLAVSRSLEIEPKPLDPITPPMSVLVIGADPTPQHGGPFKFERLGIADELAKLRQRLNFPGIVIETYSGPGTRKRLERFTERLTRIHVLHFVCHGWFDDNERQYKLIFESDRGEPEPVGFGDLEDLFRQMQECRIVLLNSCRPLDEPTGHPPAEIPDRSTAVRLAQAETLLQNPLTIAESLCYAGLPAVVSMQYRVTNDAAVHFADSLYRQLTLGYPLDYSVTVARRNLARLLPASPEWVTPLLHMHTEDGDLLGLRPEPETLISYVEDRLQQGDWETGDSVARLLLDRNCNADVSKRARYLAELAAACQEMQDRWESIRLRAVDNNEPVDHVLLASLVDVAERLGAQRLKGLLTEGFSHLNDVESASAAVMAFAAGDYDEASLQTERLSNAGPFDPELIRQAVSESRKRQDEREHIAQIWGVRDWIERHFRTTGPEAAKAHDFRDVLPAPQPGRTAIQVCNSLLAAEEPFEQGNYAEAHSLLSDVAQYEDPPDIGVAREIAAIGARAKQAEDVGGDAIKELEQALQLLDTTRCTDWLKARFRQAEHLVRDLDRAYAYAETHRLFREGRFEGAEAGFAALKDYRDSSKYAAFCRAWRDVYDALGSGDIRRAVNLLTTELAASGDDPRRKDWSRWLTRSRRMLSALEKMAAGPLVRDAQVPFEGRECPYKLLANLKITPNSTISECLESGQTAQAKEGAMSPAERDAWDALRVPDARLLVDFTLYRVRDPERAAQVLQSICSIPLGQNPTATVDSVAEELLEDAGVFYALIGDNSKAVRLFEQAARECPDDLARLHHLGIAAAAQIHAVEEPFAHAEWEVLEQSWRTLTLSWAPLFASDAFWQNWHDECNRVYGANRITMLDVHEARTALREFWLNRMKVAQDVSTSLDCLFLTELSGARAVHTGGGIPLESADGARAILGPLGTAHFGLEESLSGWAGEFGSDAILQSGWQQQVCRSFSELGTASALAGEKRWAEAIAELERVPCERRADSSLSCLYSAQAALVPGVSCAKCPDFSARNPALTLYPDAADILTRLAGEVLVQAHVNLAVEAITQRDANLDGVLFHWKQAVAASEQAGQRDATTRQIREVVVGRANHLFDNIENLTRDEAALRISEAIQILTDVLYEGWDDAAGTVRTTLTMNYIVRAYHYSNNFDDEEQGRRDAFEALKLSPNMLQAIMAFCYVSLHLASSYFFKGNRGFGEALLREVEQKYEDALRLYPDVSDVRMIGERITDVRGLWQNPAGVREDMHRLVKSIDFAAADPDADEVRQWLLDATMFEAQQNFEEAIRMYKRILRKDAANADALERMPYCYRKWLLAMDALATPRNSLIEVLREAQARFPTSGAFQDITEHLAAGMNDGSR